MIPFLFDYTSWDDWQAWLDDHAVPILLSVLALLAVHWFLKRIISRIFRHAITRATSVRYVDPVVVKRRADTFTAVLTWALGVVLFFIGAGIVLAEFGLNISTLIAAAGIVGVALGLGAQLLVRDVLNGMFILIEDQYAVGDTITVAGVTGEVIEINPRRTVLQDAEGNVHVVPNSSITVATNRTAGLNRVVVDLEVPFREAEGARTLVNAVAGELMTERARDYATAPRVADVRAIDGGDVLVRVIADAANGSKWDAEAELRRRLKRRFDTERVEMRFGGAAAEPEGAKA
jgi:small-conductance mechanosensitive channel